MRTLAADEYIDIDGTDSGNNAEAWAITLGLYYNSEEWIGDYS